MGVWIEIINRPTKDHFAKVAPFVGVWIEIQSTTGKEVPAESVAPFVGVWIEILYMESGTIDAASLPSWECGLKYTIRVDIITE